MKPPLLEEVARSAGGVVFLASRRLDRGVFAVVPYAPITSRGTRLEMPQMIS